jgi:hypothetical protein
VSARYAVYWAPPAASALWHFAARWLGRDAATGETCPAPDARHAELVADAARYGFHATLKAPIALADGVSVGALEAAVARLAARFTPFTTAPWVLANLHGFLALVPDPAIAAGRPAPLHALADAAVLALEPFRRPASEAEIARRRPERLGPAERDHLHRFGYPYVFEKFFAHLTLTCRLDDAEREWVAARLRAELAALPASPFSFHEIALFAQDSSGAPFRLMRRFPLGT